MGENPHSIKTTISDSRLGEDNMAKDKINKKAIEELPRRQGYVVTIGNSKGGVAKTTSTNLIGYNLAKQGVKTLIIDADKQGNATKTLLLTKRNAEDADELELIQKSFMEGIRDGDFADAIIPIIPNLDVVPSDYDTRDFSKYLYEEIEFQEDRDFVVHDALQKLRFEYDVILIDSPPNNYEIMRNVSLASDYVIVAFQPHEHSMTGAEDFIRDLDELKQEYEFDLYILGFLPSLVKRGGRVDDAILSFAEETFKEENIFDARLYLMERIKQFDVSGITDEETWDSYVHKNYMDVVYEFIDRLVKLEKARGGLIIE